LACTDVDYKGVVYGTQLAIHFMRQNHIPGGKIIATASVAGVYPHETYPEYNGAKAAVINFARGMAPVLKLVRAARNLFHLELSADHPSVRIIEGKYPHQHCSTWYCANENHSSGNA
jgi:hypothetical protein